jgi:molybdenum cofactor biosynthesis enzyme MoaA
MQCPRLDHFVRFNPNGTVSRCGHMVNAPQFDTLAQMDSSKWLRTIRDTFDVGLWPAECVRCQQTEEIEETSIRLNAIELDEQETHKDYLQVGGVLDNVCNAACLSCNADHSTRIGALSGRTFPIVDNTNRFWELPQERIRHLDINGGEPSYSKNYRTLLANLPPNLRTLRLNTNGSTVLTELADIAARGIEVTVTVSCDGIGAVHELVRWPLTWETFYQNLMIYKSMPVQLNLWTTVSVLNKEDLVNIQAFAREHNVGHSYAYLKYPRELNVDNTNVDEVRAYIQKQRELRGL